MLRSVLCVMAVATVCRYTVRDVGFVDLGDEPYRLYAVTADATRAETFEALATAVLLDSNVQAAAIAPNADGDHEAVRHRAVLGIDGEDTAVLVGPGERALAIPFDLTEGFEAGAAEALEAVVHSPLRSSLQQLVLEHFCVVILAEGDDADRNAAAETAIQAAFDEIAKVFDRMPKDVGELPTSLVVGPDRRGEERVTLWGLGVDPDGLEQPAAAVVFGRARRVGPVLQGAAITAASLFGILANAGQSCECGLDRSWMRGPRLPLRWDDACQAAAAKVLGFDAESPMVKSEVSSILARGPNGATAAATERSVEELLLGYSEVVLDDATATAVIDGPRSADEFVVRGPVRSGDEPEPDPVWPRVLGVALALVVVSALIAVALLRRTPK